MRRGRGGGCPMKEGGDGGQGLVKEGDETRRMKYLFPIYCQYKLIYYNDRQAPRPFLARLPGNSISFPPLPRSFMASRRCYPKMHKMDPYSYQISDTGLLIRPAHSPRSLALNSNVSLRIHNLTTHGATAILLAQNGNPPTPISPLHHHRGTTRGGGDAIAMDGHRKP